MQGLFFQHTYRAHQSIKIATHTMETPKNVTKKGEEADLAELVLGAQQHTDQQAPRYGNVTCKAPVGQALDKNKKTEEKRIKE